MERSYGTFSRTVFLPAKVKADQVKAVFKDGVLRIDLPKAEEDKVREVKVEVEKKRGMPERAAFRRPFLPGKTV